MRLCPISLKVEHPPYKWNTAERYRHRVPLYMFLFISSSVFAADPPTGYPSFCMREPTHVTCSAETYATDKVITLNDIIEINDYVNANVKYSRDNKRIGLSEWWEVADKSGDCEDFALRKAKEFTDRGFNPTLRIATVRKWNPNRGTVGHAILVVRDEQGIDWVLDNSHKEVKQIKDTGYSNWKIQKEPGSNEWIYLE